MTNTVVLREEPELPGLAVDTFHSKGRWKNELEWMKEGFGDLPGPELEGEEKRRGEKSRFF